MNHEINNLDSWDYFWTQIVEKQYQKGIDYEAYETPFCKKNYHILSEKLKKVYQEFYQKKEGKRYQGDYNGERDYGFFSNNNLNPSYSPFPWLEEILKNYRENVDYKIEYLNGYKYYTLLSDRLKKWVEEEWHQKRTKKGQTWNDFGTGKVKNFHKWIKEELPKYKEGVDYRKEKITPYEGQVDINYKILSEKMKKEIDAWNAVQVEDNSFGDFSRWFFHQGSADYHRQQEWINKENEEKRRKFIAENNPPLLKWGFLNEQDKLFNSQQSPLTEAEKVALNDPSLTCLSDWESVLWYIQANRRANSDLYSDHDFAWCESRNLKGQILEVLQKAGIPLDKLFQRVEKGRQIKKEQGREQQKKDKATILANLNDWVVYGPNTIFNWKTQQGLTLNSENMTKHRFFTEYANEHGKGDSNEGVIESYFDPATFQELRTAIFQNLLKNLRENKNYLTEYQKRHTCDKLSEKKNYLPTEWTEIQKALGKAIPVSENSSQNSPNNFSLRNKLIIASCIVSLIILILAGGFFLIKKRKKKHGSKR